MELIAILWTVYSSRLGPFTRQNIEPTGQAHLLVKKSSKLQIIRIWAEMPSYLVAPT